MGVNVLSEGPGYSPLNLNLADPAMAAALA